jgi:hypothetical protein
MIGTIAAKSEGIARGARGVVASTDGTAITLNLGFVPNYFQLINKTDVIIWEKINGMLATESIKVVTAGTTTLDTGSAIVLNADGSVTISATAAGTGKALVWLAQ